MAIRNLPRTTASLQNTALGQNGGWWIDDVGVDHTIDAVIIIALQDTIFTTLLTSTLVLNTATTPGPNLNGKTLPKGIPLYGRFTKINLQSGAIVAYASGDI